MELYGYLFVVGIIIIFLIALPLFSGVGTFKVNGAFKKQDTATNKALKFKLKEGKDNADDRDIATGVSTSTYSKNNMFEVDSKTGLKKRVIGKYNTDPNSFDYDIDDLINEDNREEAREQAQRLDQFHGNQNEAYDEFV